MINNSSITRYYDGGIVNTYFWVDPEVAGQVCGAILIRKGKTIINKRIDLVKNKIASNNKEWMLSSKHVLQVIYKTPNVIENSGIE